MQDSSSKPPETLSQDSIRENFRQYLRQADRLIIEGKFNEAKVQIAEAKKIDPRNPFIVAFEERISLFENKLVRGHKQGSPHPQIGVQKIQEIIRPEEKSQEEDQLTREMIEPQLRLQIESEYKAKYTQELHKAEEKAARILSDEREKLESQRQSLMKKYDHQLEEARKQLEQEFQKRLDEELVKAEERLAQQHEAELAFIETEMKTELTRQYEADIQALQNRMKHDQEKLHAKEKDAFGEHEQILKEQFNQKLLDALRKTEIMFQEQSRQQIQVEREKVERQLRGEYESRLSNEQEVLKRQFDEMKVKLEESYRGRGKELQTEIDGQVQEKLKLLREIEEDKFVQKRIALREELEQEFQQKYKDQIREERKRIEQEAEATIEAERKKLEDEHQILIQKQNEQIHKVRTSLRTEMEKTFLARLERVAQEYDHKMELLGAKIPESTEERLALYKHKMMSSYANGQPSVDDARALMQLKEMLELTFDEHLTIESEIRLDLYAKYVERKILSQEISANDLETLHKLKQQFNITSEESARLESYILACFQRVATRGRLLIVDDDLLLLKTLEDLFLENGYQVITSPDIETAIEKLKTQSFDLILSDIKFGAGELDGFKFFKIVQEKPKWRSIPFVFMSALTDCVIIQSGVQLGVDDYITKPMDPDLLVATIEGKLKRFRSIQIN